MQRRLIIDTNLLLLVVIGAVEERRHIRNSKRLSAYTDVDYDNVLRIIKQYDALYITPYIAAEVSNLIDLRGYAGTLAYEFARKLFANQCKKIEVDIDKDCESRYFLEYGITDCSLIRLAPDYYILTADTKLLEPLFEVSEKIIPYIPFARSD